MPAMQNADRDGLCMILNMTDLPKSVTDMYSIYQRAWCRIGSGASGVTPGWDLLTRNTVTSVSQDVFGGTLSKDEAL